VGKSKTEGWGDWKRPDAGGGEKRELGAGKTGRGGERGREQKIRGWEE